MGSSFHSQATYSRNLAQCRYAVRRKLSSSSGVGAGRTFNVAIVGGGPAGFYAASRILDSTGRRESNVKYAVDLFELLPTPFGLSRFGVAPDHPEVKNCENKFTETAKNENFRYFGNVFVTGPPLQVVTSTSSSSSSQVSGIYKKMYPHAAKVSLKDLQANYDAVMLSYGASLDRDLGLAREHEFSNVLSARTFVNWYNGHPYSPYKAGLPFDISSTKKVTIVGQGNVALDVARILLKPVKELEKTDMPDYALTTLEKSAVTEVEVVGRRGPLQIACTTKEVREMMNIENAAFHLGSNDLEYLQEAYKKLEILGTTIENSRMLKRIFDLLKRGSKVRPEDASKLWTLKFLQSPLELVPSNLDKVIEAVNWSTNHFLDGGSGNPRTARVAALPGVMEQRKTGVLFKSIGYKSIGIDGLPIDAQSSTYKNDNGRMLLSNGKTIHGLYTSGWLARGPTGVIATTLSDAYNAADSLMDDLEQRVYEANRSPLLPELRSWLEKTGAVNWKGWEAIDAEEKRRGCGLGKEREKLTSVEEALEIARVCTHI